MPNKPVGALSLEDDLKFKKRTGLPSSGHKVERVSFAIEGKQVDGFFKPCDPETYPPLLAKYEVAYSIDYQIGLGQKRAPLSKLVYNKSGEIVGSVSIALNNFKSLASMAATQIPSVERLIESDVVSVLLAWLRRKEDDGHNENFGLVECEGERGAKKLLFASIDRDMSYWPFSAHIKGLRASESTTLERAPEAKLGKLDSKDLVNFPLRENYPHFWPTQPIPITKSTKTNPCSEQFQALANKQDYPVFKEQMHMALLIELLSFQPLSLTSRLETEIGNDMPIDLNGFARLGATQATKKDRLVNRDKGLFFNARRERSFLDHITRFFTKEYEEFYRTAVFDYAPLHTFLLENPTAIDKAIKFFETENQTLDDDKQYDIGLVKQTFQKVWRDSASTIISSGAQAILASIRKLDIFVQADEKFTIKVVETAGQKLLLNDDVELLPSAHTSSQYGPAQRYLKGLYDSFVVLTKDYQQKDPVEVSDNARYVKACRTLCNEQRGLLEKDGAFNRLPLADRREILSCFNEISRITEAIDYSRLQEQRDQSLKRAFDYRGARSATTMSYSAANKATLFAPFLLNPDNCKEMQTILANWLAERSFEEVESYINKTLDTYQKRTAKVVSDTVASFVGWFSTKAAETVSGGVSNREDEIKELIKGTKEQTKRGAVLTKTASLTLMMGIFSQGGWTSTSFNTHLLQRLLPEAIKETSTQVGELEKYPHIRQIKDYVTGRDSKWLESAHIIAKDISTTFDEILSTSAAEHPQSAALC